MRGFGAHAARRRAAGELSELMKARPGAPVRMYLAGAFGRHGGRRQRLCGVEFLRGGPLCELSDGLGRFLQKRAASLVADRYTTSNAVHQCAIAAARASWDAYLDWLFDFEYAKIGIPKPDAVLYLDVDPDVSQRLMSAALSRRREPQGHSREGRELSRPQPAGGAVTAPKSWAGGALRAVRTARCARARTFTGTFSIW